jgi:putative sterol carrier protein
MSEVTEQFFQELDRRGRAPALAGVDGRVLFEITAGKHTDHWLVAIDRGAIAVSRSKGKADCTIRADVEVFERLVRGEDNAMAATLRGALVCAGEVDLLLAVQKLFPGRGPGGAMRSAG